MSDAIVSASQRRCAWWKTTPLGGPVVPDVWRIVAMASNPTRADGSASRRSSRATKSSHAMTGRSQSRRRSPRAEGHRRQIRTKLIEPLEQTARTDEKQPGSGSGKDLVDVRWRAGDVERDAGGTGEAKGDVEREIAAAVAPDDRDPVAVADAELPEGAQAGQDVATHLGPAALADRAGFEVVDGDGT